MLAFSFVGHGKELRDGAMTQKARAASMGDEMGRTQKLATKMEGKVVELET